MKFRATALLLIISALLPPLSDAAPGDDLIQSARDATRSGDRLRLERLAEQGQGHLLASYIDYWRLQLELKNDVDPAQVRAFLDDNHGSYLAEKMRGEWLKQLGKQQQWALFDAEFPALLQPDQELQCHALQSRRLRGDATMLDDAMPLWLTLADTPEACYPVLEALILEKRVLADGVWARIRRLIEANRLAGARYAMNYLPQSQTPTSATAQDVTESPLKWLLKANPSASRMNRELAALAIARIARNDPRMAAEQLEKIESRLQPGEKGWAWSQIGWQAAQRHMVDALDWYLKAGDVPMSDEVAQWKVRAALRAQDWGEVRATIEKMPPALAEQPTWTYWLGRAYRAGGRLEDANALFARVAGQPHFYGNLADEELGRTITPPAQTLPPTTAEIAAIESRTAIQRALALFGLDLRTEGVREWNWALRGMNDRELLAAASVANRAGVYDRAIAAADRTRDEHDYTLRYLSPFSEQVRPAARTQSLDDAWVYGLMRQESRFVTNARSSAGASGLMQLMPATARWVAKKIGLTDYHPGQVNNTETNLLLGTSYMRMVMESLDNSPVLASAGYNAGPGRARKWMGERPLEGAVYAETIPFNETRDYVKKVMSNAVYYSALFNGRPQSIKDRLGTIGPRATPKAEELP